MTAEKKDGKSFRGQLAYCMFFFHVLLLWWKRRKQKQVGGEMIWKTVKKMEKNLLLITVEFIYRLC